MTFERSEKKTYKIAAHRYVSFPSGNAFSSSLSIRIITQMQNVFEEYTEEVVECVVWKYILRV